MAGEKNCPPEEAGRTSGYADFLGIIADLRHEDMPQTAGWRLVLNNVRNHSAPPEVGQHQAPTGKMASA
jgi:hypothetical protein